MSKQMLAKLMGGKLRKDTAILFIGTLIGQIIGGVALLVVAKLYEVETVGQYNGLLAAGLILSSIYTLRLERAIPIPETEAQANSLSVTAVMSALALGTATFAVLLFLNLIFQITIHSTTTSEALLTIGLGVATAVFIILSQLAIRRGRYRALALRGLVQPAISGPTQIMLAPMKAVTGSLLVGYLIGRLGAVILLLRDLQFFKEIRSFHKADLRMNFKRFWKFPVISMPAGLLNSLSINLPPILILANFGPNDAGNFAVAFMLATVPMALLSAVIGQVFLGELGRLLRENNSQALHFFYKVSKLLAVSGLILVGVISALPELFLTNFLGQEWSSVGEIIYALAALMLARLVAGPLTFTLSLKEKQSWILALDCVRTLIVVSVFSISNSVGFGFIFTIWTYSLAIALTYLAAWLLSRKSLLHNLPEVVGSDV